MVTSTTAFGFSTRNTPNATEYADYQAFCFFCKILYWCRHHSSPQDAFYSLLMLCRPRVSGGAKTLQLLGSSLANGYTPAQRSVFPRGTPRTLRNILIIKRS